MSTERFAANLRVRRDDVARFVRVLIDDLRILMRGLQLVIRPAPFVSVVFLVLGAFIALTQVSQVLLAKLVVDSLADKFGNRGCHFCHTLRAYTDRPGRRWAHPGGDYLIA